MTMPIRKCHTTAVPDDAVEAAAQRVPAYREQALRDVIREDMRDKLEAAYPVIRADVLAEVGAERDWLREALRYIVRGNCTDEDAWYGVQQALGVDHGLAVKRALGITDD